jgi:hypothetical protein
MIALCTVDIRAISSVAQGGTDSNASEMEAAMDRLTSSDEQRERGAPHLLGKIGDPGWSGANNRMFLEAVLWMARVGAPWCDNPHDVRELEFGLQAVRRWPMKGVFERLFQ